MPQRLVASILSDGSLALEWEEGAFADHHDRPSVAKAMEGDARRLVQAARSGYQNLGEGSEDSATSKKLERNLTNVARASLGKLERDYVKHLARRGLRPWTRGESAFDEARALRPGTVEEAAAWVNRAGAAGRAEERAANLGAILAAQAHWLAERLLDRQARDFEAGGGFSERLYAARRGRGNGQNGHNRGGRET